MSPRTTAVLLGVAILLGAFVYFYQIGGEEGRRAAEAETRRIFPGIEADEVEAIWWGAGPSVVRANRSDGGWQLVSPVEFPADDRVLEGMASAFAKMTHESEIESPQPLEIYGLGPESPVIWFSLGGDDLGLRLGNSTPVGSNRYVVPASKDASERVYTVASWRLNAIQKEVDEVRDKQILDFDREAVDELTLLWPGTRVVLRKGRDDDWRMQLPVDDIADPSTVDRLLSDLAFLRAEGFEDDPLPDAQIGLDPPRLSVTLRLGAGLEGEELAQAPTLKIEVGAPASGDRLLVRGEHASLYELPTSGIDDFPRSVVAYRFKGLADFAAGEVHSLELRFAPATDSGDAPVLVRVERGESGWSGADPPMSLERVDALIGELAHLEATDIVAEKLGEKDLAGLELAPPRVAILAFSEKSDGGHPRLLFEIHLGVSGAARGIMVRRPDGDKIYRLDWALAESLPVSLDAYRARFLEVEVPDDNAGEETVEALPDPEPASVP